MSIKLVRRHLFGVSVLILILLNSGYAFAQTASEQIRGATVQFRTYLEYADGRTAEIGTETAYLSRNGNWTTIKRNTRGAIEQTMIADAARAGAFLVEDGEATKVGNFTAKTVVVRRSEYRQHPQFRGEVMYLGYAAFLERSDGGSGSMSELTWIPFLNLPVKAVHFNDDGSRMIDEAVSIELKSPTTAKSDSLLTSPSPPTFRSNFFTRVKRVRSLEQLQQTARSGTLI